MGSSNNHGAAGMLAAGRNCWRVEAARRGAFLVDGESYFRAVREAIARAERSVSILGWDIDSRVRLVRDDEADGLPDRLNDLLRSAVRRKRGLRVHILLWDFAMLYATDREWVPIFRLGGRTNRRIHVHLDGDHPLGASHHQKIVVVDDRVAFVGGFDLSRNRWDTSEHLADDPRRVDIAGRPYVPFHDVQLLVEGPVAAALGELARDRWHRATGSRLPAVAGDNVPWPEFVHADFTNVEVAIARTEPDHADRTEVREIEHFYLDAIAAARRTIYIENQYLTSHVVGEALADRLREKSGPEVVIVTPRRTEGWLAHQTMDALRGRLVKSLRAADRHDRLRVFFPEVPGLGEGYIKVHAKVIVVDDRIVSLGSANLCNRSMGLDTECNVALDATGDDRLSAAITAFRDRLVAEHLGATPEAVASAIAREGSLRAAVDALRGAVRTLVPIDRVAAPPLNDLVAETDIGDPERPIAAEELVGYFVPEEPATTTWRAALPGLALLALLLGVAAAWRYTSLGEWLDVGWLVARLSAFRHDLFAPVAVIAGYVLAGFVLVPVSVLIVVTVITFGPLAGFALSLSGAFLSALSTYAIGRWMGRGAVRRLAGVRLNRLSRWLGRRGLAAMIAVRVLPLAPFTVVNLVAGASHIRLRDFTLGMLIGMAPGILAVTLFTDRLEAAVRRPELREFAILALAIAAIGAGTILFRRWLRRRRPDDGAAGSPAG